MLLLSQLFPLLVLVVIIGVLILAFRLDRRVSRGAHSAGPLEPERPKPPGQERTPWELEAIEDQLARVGSYGVRAVSRYDLTATVNRLTMASGIGDQESQLPANANEAQLDMAITRIERMLELPPLDRENQQP